MKKLALIFLVTLLVTPLVMCEDQSHNTVNVRMMMRLKLNISI